LADVTGIVLWSLPIVEPIQLQCGSCGQMMAISPEHQGAQVQCPHCKAVVQTPAPPKPLAPPSSGTLGFAAHLDAGDQDSIFGQPEPTDDLFGIAPAPKIQMPPIDVAPPPAPVPPVRMEPAPSPHVHAGAPENAPGMFTETPPAAASPDADLASFAPQRRIEDRSMLGPILLIFLVPYAIFTTAFIGYLLYTWPRDNPLKFLPDNAPKGQPRLQVKHDYQLDPDMKTTLGQPIRVGAIEVTPLHVKHNAENDLILVFKAKNVSSNLVFVPLDQDYLKFSKKSLDAGRPYTFLERISKEKLNRIYGGDLDFYRGAPGREQRFDGEIGPGEEALVHITSNEDYRKREVPNFVKAPEKLIWRVQVRRGLTHVDGKDVPATTVIGIEFTARDIVRDKGHGGG
jgi:hypothetical protein